MELHSKKDLEERVVEKNSPKTLIDMHSKLTKLLKDHKLIMLTSNKELKEQMGLIANQVLKIYNKICT